MNKTVEESKVEWMKIIKYEDINPINSLFGGRLLSWMDEIAGITAIRHAGIPVTTAAIDNLQFKKRVLLGEIIAIVAKVTYVGRTSMEIRVDVFREDAKTGERSPVNRAYFTEVCIGEDGKPIPVPFGLTLTTESELADYKKKKKRIENRKIRGQEGF